MLSSGGFSCYALLLQLARSSRCGTVHSKIKPREFKFTVKKLVCMEASVPLFVGGRVRD